MESYHFHLTGEADRFHEQCAWMGSHALRCCNPADPMHRPGDGVLRQADLAFAPANCLLFARTHYR